ncbi:MAG: sulfotransferase [Paracoccaceae bacterium]
MAKLDNTQVKKLFQSALQARGKGELDRAGKLLRKIRAARPELAEVHFHLAEIAATKFQANEALASYEAALKLRPKEPAIWLGYMEIVMRHDNIDAIANMVENSARALGAHHPAVTYFRGGLATRRESDEAIDLFRQAIKGGLKYERAHIELNDALVRAEQHDAALEAQTFGLKQFPKSAQILGRRASLLRDLGRFDEALEASRTAIAARPGHASLYHAYVSISKVKPGDPMIGQMQQLFGHNPLAPNAKSYLGFALAKAMEDTKQYDKVFRYLDVGNKAQEHEFPYDLEADLQAAAQIRTRYERIEADAPKATGHKDAAPIFVTGMPRSGTTLVEQIISAHSTVTGGGELGMLEPCLRDLGTEIDGTEALNSQNMTTALQHAVQSYLDAVASRLPGADLVTDKSISTYASIGLVKRMMPKARIVVVRRDPRDNALSIYKNMFRHGSHRYSNNLRNIARFMKIFEAQLAYWKRHCPDQFYEIRYEELTADPEVQSRALIDAVGLEWEDSCLSFYESKRMVKTLSSAQVRQPMYSSSVAAWKRFEKELQPFIDEYESFSVELED